MDVLSQLGQIFSRKTNRYIGQQPHEPENAITLPDGIDSLFGDLNQLVAVRILELARKSIGQRAINAQADSHSAIFAIALRVVSMRIHVTPRHCAAWRESRGPSLLIVRF